MASIGNRGSSPPGSFQLSGGSVSARVGANVSALFRVTGAWEPSSARTAWNGIMSYSVSGRLPPGLSATLTSDPALSSSGIYGTVIRIWGTPTVAGNYEVAMTATIKPRPGIVTSNELARVSATAFFAIAALPVQDPQPPNPPTVTPPVTPDPDPPQDPYDPPDPPPIGGSNMSWPEARLLAKAGEFVGLVGWPSTRVLRFERDGGTAPAIAVVYEQTISTGGTITRVRRVALNTDFTRIEWEGRWERRNPPLA